MHERKLAAADRPKSYWEFTVEGNGEFPWDMLRYDRCWPASEDQIVALAPYHRGELFKNTRQVKMRGLNEPTPARWESFGWKVVS